MLKRVNDTTTGNILTLDRWLSWIFGTSTLLVMSWVFWGYDILLFTEANDWFFSTYIADSVKNAKTADYQFALFNTPNAIFLWMYLYLKDVFYFCTPYTLMKGIYYTFFLCFFCNIIILSRINRIYLLLAPLTMSYILVGGMVNYYVALVLISFYFLRLETVGKIGNLESFLFVIALYHSHFMAFFAFMLFILYKEGLKKTCVLSVIPFLLLVTYKANYTDYWGVESSYNFLNHFLSIRRILLPSLVDMQYSAYQYYFSALINLLYIMICFHVLYHLIYQHNATSFLIKTKGRFLQPYLFLFFLMIVYFIVPATLKGSGINIHERLIIPFIFIFSYHMRTTTLLKTPFMLICLLLSINLLISQEFYDFSNIDTEQKVVSNSTGQTINLNREQKAGILYNRIPIGISSFLAKDMIAQKELDHIKIPTEYRLFTTSIITLTPNHPRYKDK